MSQKRHYRRMPPPLRAEILSRWRRGWRVSEIAAAVDSYHQQVSWVIRSSSPSFEEQRRHDHFRRVRQRD